VTLTVGLHEIADKTPAIGQPVNELLGRAFHALVSRRADDEDVLAGEAPDLDGLLSASIGIELLKLLEPVMWGVDGDIFVGLFNLNEPRVTHGTV
jgi:hypothetical protein